MKRQHIYGLSIMVIFISVILIPSPILVKNEDLEKDINILKIPETPEVNDTMIYDYRLVGDVSGDVEPLYNHLVFETTYGLYYIEVGARKLWQLNVSTLATTLMETRTRDVVAGWYDRDNERILFVERSTGPYLWEINLATDAITELANDLPGGTPPIYWAIDVFMIGTDIYVLTEDRLNADIDINARIYKYVAPNLVLQISQPIFVNSTTTEWSFSAIIDGLAYFLVEDVPASELEMWAFDPVGSTITKKAGIATSTLKLPFERALTYDDINIVSFMATNAGSKLHYFSIADGTITNTGTEYYMILMLDRNTDTSNDPPFNLEKGINFDGDKIHQITRNITPADLYFISQPDIGTNYFINWVTDTYILTENSVTGDIQLWEYELIDLEISFQNTFYKQSTASRAEVQTNLLFNSGQILELYENISNPGVNTLAFRGTFKRKTYQGDLRTYFCVSHDKEIVNTRVTKDYAGLGLTSKGIMEDVLDVFGTKLHYLSTPDSIDPDGDFVVVREPNFKNKRLDECFDELMDDEDGAWAWDQDLTVYSWHITNIPPQQIIRLDEDYLHATYNFKYDTLLAIPNGWIDSGIVPTGHAYIIASYQGHNKVLELFDGTGQGVIAQVFSDGAQITGTIEWYMGLPDVTKEHKIHFADGYPGYTTAVAIRNDASKLQYWNGGWIDVGVATVNDVMYHCKLIFNCTTDTFKFYVDGILYQNDVAMNGNRAGIDAIEILSVDAASYAYYDAFGYSWDPEYNVGDNLLAMRIFQAGYYQSKYNFKNDPIASTPSGFITTIVTGTLQVIAELDGHNKVVELHDTGAASVRMKPPLFGSQPFGTIEFWHRTTDATKATVIDFWSSVPAYTFSIIITADTWSIVGDIGLEVITGVGVPLDDVWYHIRVDFEATAGVYLGLAQFRSRITIDGTPQTNPDFGWVINSANWDFANLGMGNVDQGYYTYYDAIGYSWDNKYVGETIEYGYEIGDNLIEEHIHITENPHATHAPVVVDKPFLDQIMEQINKVKLYGGVKNGARLQNVSPFGDDLPAQLTNGIVEYVDYYEGIADQDEINALSDNVLNRTGFADNPFYIEVYLQGLGYRLLTKSFKFKYAPYDELVNYNTYYNLELELDLDDLTIGKYTFSSGLIQQTREAQANVKKTSTSDEGQIDIIARIIHDKIGLTTEGGNYIVLTNKTGAPTVKGELVKADPANNNAVILTAANDDECFGAFYESGIADGSEVKVCYAGIVEVMLVDATAATAANWAKTGAVAGRADITAGTPAAAPTHFEEIGHGIETVGAGVSVLAKIIAHFN